MGRTADYFDHEFINIDGDATAERAKTLKFVLRGLGAWMDVQVFPVNDGVIDWGWGVPHFTWCYGKVELPKLGKAYGYLVRRHASVDESRFAQDISAENFRRLARHIEAYEKEERWNYRD